MSHEEQTGEPGGNFGISITWRNLVLDPLGPGFKHQVRSAMESQSRRKSELRHHSDHRLTPFAETASSRR